MILGHSNLKILNAMKKQMKKELVMVLHQKLKNEMAKRKENVKSIQKS